MNENAAVVTSIFFVCFTICALAQTCASCIVEEAKVNLGKPAQVAK